VLNKQWKIKLTNLAQVLSQKHSADPNILTVFDIRPSSIPLGKKAKFVEAIERAVSNGDISRILYPGNSTDPAYHIEIKVKNCTLKKYN
ncbi:hypothetical protein, partial [Aquimarina agarilytica]|uniref:hypothetical protein n=1 Tax=Aquimarina agarilytica TaxID=1087449 RepID=UPI0002898B3E